MTTHDHTQNLHDQAQRIAAHGRDIRKQIESLVQDVTKEVKAGSRRLADIAQEVLDGAAAGIKESAPPDDRENRFRQVIDGLGDGFSRAANATKLAIEEAQTRGEHFARHDLNDMQADLRSLADLFVDVVSRTASRASNLAQKEAGDVVDHARRTMDSIRPSIDQAIDAAKDDPAKLGKETADALGQASRQAVGALFGAVGDLLKHAADRLAPDKHAGSGSCCGGSSCDSKAAGESSGGSGGHAGGERAE